MERALVPLREAYRESALPPAYFAALEQELGDVVPTRWRDVAAPFTAVERKGFGSWRGGDVYARVAYVFIGLLVGGLCVKLPFIPIWKNGSRSRWRAARGGCQTPRRRGTVVTMRGGWGPS